MKIVIGILFIIVFVMAWLLFVRITTESQQRKQIEELKVKLADKTKLVNLELQEKCSSKAKEVFRFMGYNETNQNGDMAGYQSHFNTKLGKCFMTIESLTVTKGNFVNNSLLFDAYEQREYAEYAWMPRNNKKYWEVPPLICKLIPSSTSEQFCKSEDEYKAFVAKYME